MDKQEKLAAEIFDQAAVMDSAEARDAYVRGACRGNEQLYQRVQELLASYSYATNNRFLKTAVGTNDAVTLDDKPLAEGPGTVINRYKLLQKIGEGGMGVVYMAEQNEPVKRKVALKIINLGMDTKHVVARFEAERQALAMMDHPNIARVLDGGSTETGRPFFVMELVKGVPITEFCDKNKLSPRERLKLFMQVCKAIQSAHQKGIIHRDIKPSNILVTLHHGDPLPKVIDFGIAKATNQKLTEKTLFTNYAQLIGTPAYMSPEQAEMSTLDVDTRSDVYSLGVLLYELLTGTAPFPEKELLSRGYGEMQRIITEKEPDKPSFRMSTMQGEQQALITRSRASDTSILARQFKGDLDLIVMKSLEKDRNRRYETANSLAEDVQRHLDNQPILAAAPTISYQFRKFLRRQQKWISKPAAVAMLTLIGLGLLMAMFQMQKAQIARREAERARMVAELKRQKAEEEIEKANQAEDRANKETVKADQTAQFMIHFLEQSIPELMRKGNVSEASRFLEHADQLASEPLKDSPFAEIKLRRFVGIIHQYVLNDSVESYRQAKKIRQLLANMPPETEAFQRELNLEMLDWELWHARNSNSENLSGLFKSYEEALTLSISSEGKENSQIHHSLASLIDLYNKTNSKDPLTRVLELTGTMIESDHFKWGLNGKTCRLAEKLLLLGNHQLFGKLMQKYPGIPQSPNWQFQLNFIGLLHKWIDMNHGIEEPNKIKSQWLESILTQMTEHEWPQKDIRSLKMIKARLEAQKGNMSYAVATAMVIGTHSDCGFEDWRRAMDLILLNGSPSEIDKLRQKGIISFATSIQDKFIYRMVRLLLFRPSSPAVLDISGDLIQALEDSSNTGYNWSQLTLPFLKAMQCYRQKEYQQCIEYLDANQETGIGHESVDNVFSYIMTQAPAQMFRSMALAQLGRKSEALNAYNLAKSTAVERRNATDDMIKRYFSECTSLLREKGILPAD